MGVEISLIPDISCKEATELYTKNLTNPSALSAAILTKHEEKGLHDSDCYTQLQTPEQQTAQW